MKKIIFYGASVTWQRDSHKGEMTGFFPYCEAMLRDIYGDTVEIHRFAHVGGHMDGAAWIGLSDIIHLIDEDTLVVSDWHSTSLGYFSPQALNHYYNVLTERKCRILNVIFPMKSSVGKERLNIRQTRYLQNYRFCILNFYSLNLDLDLYVRDDVHTNSEGAKVYAGIMASAVQKMLEGEVLLDSGPVIPVPPTPAAPDIYSVAIERDILPGGVIEFDFGDISDASTIEIYSQVKKGPSSPTLRIQAGDTTTAIEIWDRWSYYEPDWSTFIPITRKLALTPENQRVTITVSETPPDYAALSVENPKALEAMQKITTPDLRLRLREKLYFVGARPTAIRINGEPLPL